MRHGSLFSGIGGFDLAAEWMGWDNVFHCEWNKFCQQVLKKNFPNSKGYADINTFNAKEYKGVVDIISGGFPCQPYSLAGLQKGTDDSRHLWPQMLRIIREVKPRWVVGENVPGIVSWGGGLVFEQVQVDLEVEGYEVQAFILPACGIGALHKRERVWFVANFGGKNIIREGMANVTGNIKGKYIQEEWGSLWDSFRLVTKSVAPTEFGYNAGTGYDNKPLLIGIPNGVPSRLDEDRNAALGNAIVPQVALEIFKAIEKMETLYCNL